MARPSTPLIVREVVLKRALDLIEDEGYEGFSIPRLAQRLGVRSPSLYYHFANRSEVLIEATRTVIDTADLPACDLAVPWREWCLSTALAMRDMILARPGVAPVVTWYLSTIGVPDIRDRCVKHLIEHDVPPDQSAFVIDTVERMTVGSAWVEAMRNRAQNPNYKSEQVPKPADDADSREFFAASIRTFLAGVTVDGEQTPDVGPRPAG